MIDPLPTASAEVANLTAPTMIGVIAKPAMICLGRGVALESPWFVGVDVGYPGEEGD
jgi:hypothetical protein